MGAINTACPVCLVKISECAGAEKRPDETTAPDKTDDTEGPYNEKKSSALIPVLVLILAAGGGAAIDLQGYTYDLPSKDAFRKEFSHLGYSFIRDLPKEVVVDEKVIQRQMELIDRVHHAGAEVLISTHPWVPMNCEQVVDLALFLEKRNPDVIKIVTPCYNDEQLAESFKTMLTLKKEVKTKVHFHCCGAAGSLTRIINPVLGGYLIFCSESFTTSSNFEQLDLTTAKNALDNLRKIM